MRFTFIAAKKAEHPVTILCRCLRVTRSGFYAVFGREGRVLWLAAAWSDNAHSVDLA